MANFLQFLLESAACLTVFYAAYWLFLKNETFFVLNRVYLVTALLASWIIPAVRVTSPIYTKPAVPLTPVNWSFLVPPEPAFSFSQVVLAVYAAGVIFLGARFGLQLWQIFRTIKTSAIQSGRDYRYVFTHKNIQPFSFFKYIFLNKDRIPPQNLTRILAHERVHIKQHHSMDILLMELVTILQWFNPFVWPYKISLKETHEYLADGAVIAQGCSAAGYQLLILEQHVGGRLVELANNFHHSQIKRRITMMTKIKSKGTAKLKLLLILPLATVLVLALAEPRVIAQTEAPMDDHLNSASEALPVETQVPSQEKSDQQKKEEQIKAEKEKKMQEKKKQEEFEKVKKEQEILKMKMEEIKVALDKTEDAEKRKELKVMYKELSAKSEKIDAYFAEDNGKDKPKYIKVSNLESIDSRIKELEQALKRTDNPEKKEQMKQMLVELLEKREAVAKKNKK
jgi:hypothetical protein